MEFLDAFTFQGGDVQVDISNGDDPVPQKARVSNNVFDMRDGQPVQFDNQTITMRGPYFGLMMVKRWVSYLVETGYFDQEVHLVNNTFVLGDFEGPPPTSWPHPARLGAVGIIDVNDPRCNLDPNGVDTDMTFRGLGHAGLQNNLLRTRTVNAAQDTNTMALVGISVQSASVSVGGGSFVDTNAYPVKRSGVATTGSSSAGSFHSLAMRSLPVASVNVGQALGFVGCTDEVLWDCPKVNGQCQLTVDLLATPFLPRVRIFDGDQAPSLQEYDPAFVGEYVRTLTGVPASYNDWRLIPGSALRDQGLWGAQNTFQRASTTSIVYSESPCAETLLSDWDGEEYGNPRIVDGYPDIGFDEIHLSVMCGSYANSSNSHNLPSFLDPLAPASQPERFVLLPRKANAGQDDLLNRTLKVYTNQVIPPAPPAPRNAWTKPPGSLASPTQRPGSPTGYDLVYTSTTNQVSGSPWQVDLVASATLKSWPNWQGIPDPGSTLGFEFFLVDLVTDNEPLNFAAWMNSFAVVLKTSPPVVTLYGNMQNEFR